MGGLSWDKPGQIEVISGAYCFLRKAALDRIGLLDEDFFMYGEDIDLSYRLLKGTMRTGICPLESCITKEKAHRNQASDMFMCSMMQCLSSSVNTMEG